MKKIAADVQWACLAAWSDAVLCPVCGSRKVRPVRVRCNPAGETGGEVSVDARGVHIDKSVKPCSAGVVIAIDLCCEKGHWFCASCAYGEGRTLAFTLTNGGSADEKVIWAP